MPEEIWKEFETNEISHSVAHHLTAIGELTAVHGYARVSDGARHLKITRGSASLTLKSLKRKDFVREDENKVNLYCDQCWGKAINILQEFSERTQKPLDKLK